MASDYWKCTLCVGYNNNKVLDLSENVSGLIDYVLYPLMKIIWFGVKQIHKRKKLSIHV